MSTTTDPKPKARATGQPDPDLAALLGTESMPLAEVRATLGESGELALAKAWAAGLIEFGHRKYCVTGPAGKMGSVLVVEDLAGWEWSGPKTNLHKSYRDLRDEAPPKTDKCKKYEEIPPERFGEEPSLKPVEIPAAQAHAAIALHVRLTDKGLSATE